MPKMQTTSETSQNYGTFVDYSSNNEEKSSQSDEGSSWDIPIRTRQRFPRDQLKALESLYNSNKKPSYEDKRRISLKYGITIKRVQIWFQNRRAKDKKGSSKEPKGEQASETNSLSVSQTSSPQETSSPPISASTVSTRPETATVNPIHITSHSPDKISKLQRTDVPRRYPPRERLPVHYPTGAPMHNTPQPLPLFYHPHYYPSDMWHPKLRVGVAPHIFNQSRTATVEPQTQQQQHHSISRRTRSHSKKRKI